MRLRLRDWAGALTFVIDFFRGSVNPPRSLRLKAFGFGEEKKTLTAEFVENDTESAKKFNYEYMSFS